MAWRTLSAVVASGVLAGACARNPATGVRQLMLVDEGGEITMGHDADRQVTARLGLVEDPALQAYVTAVGARLAASSERPRLPWSFRVVDDPAVNAFALPGGYVHLTRGLLAHLDSEAELAAVIAHEIGHVTARHAAGRSSQAQLAIFGLGLGAVCEPHLARNLDLAEAGLALVMLKGGRDDEREADVLGMRYLRRTGYTTGAVARVLGMLARVEAGQPQASLPEWLSTHPDPASRLREAESLVSGEGRDGRRAYLAAIDGLVFGNDPRDGFLRGTTLVHPTMDMRIEVPRGWSTRNTRTAVTAVSPDGDAALALDPATASSALTAAQAFSERPNLQAEPPRREGACWMREFRHKGADGASYRGLVCFVEQDRHVFRLVGYSRADRFDALRPELSRAIASLRPAGSTPAAVAPRRVQVLDPGPLRLDEAARAYPSAVPLRTLAILNGVDPEQPDSVVPRPMKRIVRGSQE